MDDFEKAFIIASIQKKQKNDEKERKKLRKNGKKRR
nr:MAG TPA_asm: hypothetical protein [Caudoviricetes sp.]